MNKYLMILLLGLVAMTLAKPSPDFDFDDDDDDDDDDHFFRFNQNSVRRDTFQPSFRFNSFDRSSVGGFQQQQRPVASFQPRPTFQQQPSFQPRTSFQQPRSAPTVFQQQPSFQFQQQPQSFSSFRPTPRECWPPPPPGGSTGEGGAQGQGGATNRHGPEDESPVLTIVRFSPFTLVRPSEAGKPALFLYDSKHVAVLSHRCSISEILDLATTMIISTINNRTLVSSGGLETIPLVAAVPKGIQKSDGIIEQEQSLGHYQHNKSFNKKKEYKTIRDFNPNPFLLSKKAVKTRKLKLEMQKEENGDNFDENEHLQNDVNPLGGKLWEIVKTDSLVSKFDSNTTVNSIKLPPLKITNSEYPIRVLGSRQKPLTTTSPSLSLSRQDPVPLSSLIKTTNSKTLTNGGAPDSSGFPPPLKTSRVLGSRQHQLLGGAPPAQAPGLVKPHQQVSEVGVGTYLRRQDAARWRQQEDSRRRRKPSKRARVRKVLKGRRKVTSAEFRKRQTHKS